MKQNEWKILYSTYHGIAKKALHFLSKEAGKLLIREQGVYRLYVLPCEKEGAPIPKNAFFLGLYRDSPFIQSAVAPDEVPKNGYLIKVVENPESEEGRLVILTAHEETELFYAAVDFVDRFIPSHAPKHGSNLMPDLIFDSPLPLDSYSRSSDFKTRSIFTWGHPINDYRAYVDRMARAKFNQLILWNDFVPLNISEIIDYAHSYGIEVNLGYSWGWSTNNCETTTDLSDGALTRLKDQIVAEYMESYADTGCDGIYFQSFTERKDFDIGGRSIAEAVTSLVNMTAHALWEIKPDLKLQFGLHATSVRNDLPAIAKVDPRIEILWEDCGEFPYSYRSFVKSEEAFAETLAFTKKLLELREGACVGLLFKGMMVLDWKKFVHQPGPFIMGENHPSVTEHDRAMRKSAWYKFSADWMKNGHYAAKTVNFIQENKMGEVNLCIAGAFDGATYFPFAFCGQLFRESDAAFDFLVNQTLSMPHVELG